MVAAAHQHLHDPVSKHHTMKVSRKNEGKESSLHSLHRQ
jgi:hypothetical protein